MDKGAFRGTHSTETRTHALPDPVLPWIRGFKRAEHGQECVLRHVGIGVQNKRLNIT
jgi:hypothetical protein